MQLLRSLHKTGLIGFLQHLLSIAHQPTVLQHTLVLFHLGNTIYKSVIRVCYNCDSILRSQASF